jgi:hypothetical protein
MTDETPRAKRADCDRQSLRAVNPRIVSKMHDQLVGQTDATLMGRFGISYNTWRKVRSGEPIRRSVAERLEQRMSGGNQR